jgi:hypothetical protein
MDSGFKGEPLMKKPAIFTCYKCHKSMTIEDIRAGKGCTCPENDWYSRILLSDEKGKDDEAKKENRKVAGS